MKKKLLLLIFLINFSFANAQIDSTILNINEYLEELSQGENFGLSICISKSNNIVLNKAYGYASREYEVKNTIDTKFNIASIGKMFTSVAILQLVESEQLALHQTIGHYLPEFPNSYIKDSVTIHQLLTHSSGLPLWFSKDFDSHPKFDFLTLDDYLDLYENIEIDRNKIGHNNYSNVGFITLGFVIEAVTNMSYEEYLTKYIFEPLNMKETGLWKLTEIIPNSAIGYMRPANENDWWKTNYHLNKGGSPAGGAYASTKDLVTFFNGLNNHQLLNKTTTELMMSPKIATYYGDYGYGIGISEQNGQPILGHLGGYYGVRGELMWYKNQGYIVAILANSDQTNYIDVSCFIKNQLTGTDKEKAVFEHTITFIKIWLLAEAFDISDFDGDLNESQAANFDESLIQIKGYYYYNLQDYKMAKRFFELNAILFPESKSAKNDLKRVEGK